ncbi:hypothetical protein OEZ85_001831 [Tetradesmus obliquus]|uniref:Protein kinase domain-containing protein n=1 Tax=Tetradesmus obliquus TaxID=3088 RepID=A0ABY8U118_TETOB|nr:hypothetical protein OEZ85_001831 [Tetradesmus obliquus]
MPSLQHQSAPAQRRIWAIILVAAAGAAAAATAGPACLLAPGQAEVFTQGPSCVWESSVAVAGDYFRVSGSRSSLEETATPVVVAPASPLLSTAGSPGASLLLERLVLVGFDYAAPGGAAPVLWPAGLLQSSGSALNLTDVRLVTSSPDVFNVWLRFFTSDSRVAFWTDNSSFLYVHEWADGRTQLSGVGLLLQAQQRPASPAAPAVKNCITAATNNTLVPSLMVQAAIVTPQPLLVFITTNVTLGTRPPLPPEGLQFNRPVVLVGLQSAVTSVDFEMVVNQLNLTGSKYSNVTFVGLVLENIAPGDAATSVVAAPFSIAISNNLWAAYYNRTAANNVRLALFNTTMVLPQESEMAYVTYMFTMYTSALPYLRRQTSFYSDVLHMTILQFAPGPGSRAITVSRLKSWYHWWRNTVLTTDPIVAAPLPVPPRQLVLSTTTRASPLVQAVHSTADLRSFSEMTVVGDRAHILLVLSNVSLTESAGGSSSSGAATNPIRVNSAMSWLGSSPAAAPGDMWPELQKPGAAAAAGGWALDAIAFGYMRDAIILPESSPKDALQLQQLVLWQLPQGPDVGAAVAAGNARIPAELWTLLLWSIKRPMKVKALNLDGVLMQLPGPELEYIQAAAKQSTDFVVELSGVNGDALTFQDVEIQQGLVHVGALQGPGLVATNLTLDLDPAAVTAIPGGYVWPDRSRMPQPVSIRGHYAPWVSAVIAVAVVLGVALLALIGVVVWRSRRGGAAWCRADSKHSLLDSPSKHTAHSSTSCSCRHHLDGGSGLSVGVCGALQSSAGSQGLGRPGSIKCSDTGLHSDSANCTHSSCVLDVTPVKEAVGAAVVAGPPAVAGDRKQRRSTSSSSSGCNAQQQGQQQQQHSVDVSALRDAPVPVHMADALADSVAAGMQRWRTAVSNTTMLLMERRMDAANYNLGSAVASAGAWSTCSTKPLAGAGSSDGCAQSSSEQQQQASSGQSIGKDDPQQQSAQQLQQQGSGAFGQFGMLGSTPPQLQLLEMLGQGSCGCVYLANWRGKRVAVKVMHLPANALLGPQGLELAANAHQGSDKPGEEQDPELLRQRRRARVMQQNSAPHMAIMEAVLSSAMSHPNVVQVYTYMLNPLTRTGGANGAAGSPGATSWPKGQDIAGWELKLIMEYCSEGSLRDALDCKLLSKAGSYMAPSVVLTLAHDIAAAMLHLHSEGIVHADLKAANVMLTNGGDNANGTWGAAAGGRRMTAKVADFGLALPLDPSDTHATLSARGTPTHMSPELFMSGHVSKAGDVYAYGILLYEVMTGQRAYAGVPIPLLPHEVARQGLRPAWPANLPPGCRDLQRLAEACWAQQPQDRPTFAEIMHALELWTAGSRGWPPAALPSAQPAAAQQQQQAAAARSAAAAAAAAAAGAVEYGVSAYQ